MWQSIKCFFGFHHWVISRTSLPMLGGWRAVYDKCWHCGADRQRYAECPAVRKDKPHAPPTQHKPGDRVSFEVFGSHYPER